MSSRLIFGDVITSNAISPRAPTERQQGDLKTLDLDIFFFYNCYVSTGIYHMIGRQFLIVVVDDPLTLASEVMEV